MGDFNLTEINKRFNELIKGHEISGITSEQACFKIYATFVNPTYINHLLTKKDKLVF